MQKRLSCQNAELDHRNIIASTALLEKKLVELKLEFAHKSEEVEEIKDTLADICHLATVKDKEIMKLNREIEKINDSIEEQREALKPPRQSMGSPKNHAIFLRKKN